jgi:hypothetical protein
MAWPLTPLRTFIANSVPVIDALFLNLIQKWTNDLSEGIISVLSLTADGTGGIGAAPNPGTLNASREVISTTYPTPGPDIAPGEYTRDSALAALASISGGFVPPAPGSVAGGGLIGGFGIRRLNWLAAGDYEVTLQAAPSGGDARHSVVHVTPSVAGGADISKSIGLGVDAGRLKLHITLAAGVDVPFDLVAWVW